MKKILYYPVKLIFRLVPNNLHFLIEKFFNKLRIFSMKYSYNFEKIVNLKIEDTKFKIFLRKNNIQGHSVYCPMSEKKYIHEIAIITCLKSLLKKKDKVVFADLGAFVGYYAIYFAKLFEDSKKVYAFESNEDYCDDIYKSMQLNNLKNIKIFKEILSDKVEDQIFYREFAINKSALDKEDFKSDYNFISTSNTGNSNTSKYYDDLKKFGKIKKTKTLDSLLNNETEKPNILKVDVHGAEGKIFAGANNLLKNDVEAIFLELHSEKFIKKFSEGHDRVKIILNLINKGFSCYLINPFRKLDNSGQDEDYLKNSKKLKWMEISSLNLDSLLFGRDKDLFLLCLKKNIDIKSLDCF